MQEIGTAKVKGELSSQLRRVKSVARQSAGVEMPVLPVLLMFTCMPHAARVLEF